MFDFLSSSMIGFIPLLKVSSSKLCSSSSYISFNYSTVWLINFKATPHASLFLKDSSYKCKQASISFRRAKSPLTTTFSTSYASGSSIICPSYWLLLMGTVILAGSFSLCSSRNYKMISNVSESISSKWIVVSFDDYTKYLHLGEYFVNSSSWTLSSVPSEVTIFNMTLGAFSGGGCGGGCCTSTFFLAPICQFYKIVQMIIKSIYHFHNLLAWINFFPTLKKSFSWWVVSCIMLKKVFSITISVISKNSSFKNIHSWFEKSFLC